MQYNWTPYAVGGATRPDSFTRMTPEMQQGLWSMLQAADADLGSGLQVYSGYRSPELQAQLFQNALKKYGSEQAARKWVAPPGRSKHNSGQAADLKWNGTRIDKLPADHPVRVWLQGNVEKFGLARPMSWEPWQVEVAGARGNTPQAAPAASPIGAIAGPPAPAGIMTAGPIAPPAPEGPSGLFASLADLAKDSPIFGPQMMPVAPPPMMPRAQVQPIQTQRRDTVSPYLALFEQLRG